MATNSEQSNLDHRQDGLSRRSNSAQALTVLEPRRGWRWLDFKELLRYRGLLWVLTLRDIKVRYKQTALGVIWAVLQPVLSVAVFAFIFGRVLGMQDKTSNAISTSIPYFVFLFSGQLPWILFSSSVAASGLSLVSEAQVLRKIYFPRILVPLAAIGAPLVDYLVGFAVFLVAMAWSGVPLTPKLALTPLLLGSTLLAAAGTGILISAITVFYRDFRHILPFTLQLWFFVTPVIYPVELLPEKFNWLLYLNPMFGPIEGFRAVVLNTQFNVFGWAVSTTVGLVIFVVGIAYFSRVEHWFADIA